VLAALNAARANLPSLLLVGSPGVGKQITAARAAHAIGIEFVHVRLDLVSRDVVDTLCGSLSAGERASDDQRGPGELGYAGARLLYMSHLEGMDPSLFQRFGTLLTNRKYVDALGREWKINDDLWLVCGLTILPKANIGLNHWITAAFQARIMLADPDSAADYQVVAEGVARRCSTSVAVATDVGSLLQEERPVNEYFHAVRRWVETACAASHRVDRASLQAAVLQDLSWLLVRVHYRGSQLEVRHVTKWLEQIPSEYRRIGFQLVRQLAERYFMAPDEYYRGLGILIEQARIPAHRVVSFCKWQPLGKSAPHLNHELKNQARWKLGQDIDFSVAEAAWPRLSVDDPAFVLADDFVGSGGTLSSLTAHGEQSVVARLARSYPKATFAVLLLVAYDEPASRAIKSLRELVGGRISVSVYRVLTSSDQCFTSESTIIRTSVDQTALKRLCISLRSKYFPSLPTKFTYGYEQTGAVFSFFNSVPNNSLPILWHDQGKWFPLLPASGVLT